MRIDTALLAPVFAWAIEKRKFFQSNGFARQYGILYRKDLNPPPEVWEIRQKIFDENGLHGLDIEPMFQDFCGFITSGGAIHPHQDSDHNGKKHVRFNVMVSKPEQGGVPVQNGLEIAVEEGGVWRCDSSAVQHWCTEVVGSKPRIVLSYGVLI